MHGEERDGVLAAHAGGVQILGRPVFTEDVEVVEKRLQGGAALQRAPLLGEVEESVQVELGAEPGGLGKRLDLRPGARPVENGPTQLDEAHLLGIPQQAAEPVAKRRQSADRLIRQSVDLPEAVDCFEHCPTPLHHRRAARRSIGDESTPRGERGRRAPAGGVPPEGS